MSLINISRLSFAYDGSYDYIFDDVSLQLDTDWKLGFTGRNGRGKTTFLRLLCADYEYRGTISAAVDFDYFPLAPDLAATPLATIADRAPGAELWEAQRELSLLEVDEAVWEQPLDTLSPGERTKVLLAALFLQENHFLLIDEPTNHLDAEGRAVVGRYLQKKKGFILVSHDRDFLDSCVDHILAINKTNMEIQKGNFSSWWQNQERQNAFEAAENAKLQQEVKQLTAAARRAAGWSEQVEKSKRHIDYGSGAAWDKGYIGHQAARTMQRAKNLEQRRGRALSEKAGLLQNLERAEDLSLQPLVYHAERLATLDQVSLSYGERTVCANVSFTIDRGERVALLGANGSGKSSLLKRLVGEEIATSGRLQLGSQLKISCVAQDTSFLTGNMRDFVQARGLDETRFKTILRKLDFPRADLDKELRALSAGQKKKVLLAQSLCTPAHLYIWDEPLNFIDVLSRMQIEDLILRSAPTLLFVEHDAAFVRKIATKTVTL
jgi:lincosamide and streptogramin A transport system ATP-binding/permease protein